MDIVKRFLFKDSGNKKKNKSIDDNFEEEQSRNSEDEEVFIKAPVLYIRPKIEDIKEMLKTYLEIKKI